MKPALLFLSQRLPYPPTKGEKIRALRIFRYLAQWYDIHLGCLMDNVADMDYVATMRALCADMHVAVITPKVAKVTCLRGLLTGEALSVTYFQDRALNAWVQTVLREVKPAVIFVYSSNMVPYILDTPFTGRRVVDLVDIDSEKWRAYADGARGLMKWIYRREWRKITALEHRIARECDVASFVSDAEADLFRQLLPGSAERVLSVSNGVDIDYFDPSGDYPPLYDTTRPNFVFTGTMDYPPNADAVVWFATRIFPLIRADLPAAQFHIVGHSPTDEVRRLATIDGVHVTGRVTDVRPYVAHATASVAPLRIARGIQNKVLEAMAMAKPVVVTSGALEGIDAQPGTEVIVADTVAAFASACVGLATGPEALTIGKAARARAIGSYDWSVRLSQFDKFLRPAEASA